MRSKASTTSTRRSRATRMRPTRSAHDRRSEASQVPRQRIGRPRIVAPPPRRRGHHVAYPTDEAQRVGDAIGVDWNRFDLEQFRMGMDVEFEHGSHDPQTNVTGDDPILTGKIALAHMKEFPDYYERLERMEREAELDWSGRRG